jgi:hypothetical protein
LRQFLEILAWVATNGQTEATLQTNGWAPLTIAYKKRLIDQLGLVQCQNEQALQVAYLVGMGGPIAAFDDWAQEYSTNSFVQKYFDSNTTLSITALQDGTPHHRGQWAAQKTTYPSPHPAGDVDFGSTMYVLDDQTLKSIGEDAERSPSCAILWSSPTTYAL